jgi:hypothetical protein
MATASKSANVPTYVLPKKPGTQPARYTVPINPPRRSGWAKAAILIGLLGVWVSILAPPWWTRNAPAPRSATATPPMAGRSLDTRTAALPRLRRDLVDLPRRPYPEESQNLFSAPPPPAPPPPAVPAPPPPVPVQVRPTPPPPDPFAEGAKQLRYLGFVDMGDVRTAMITQGAELFLVATGEMLTTRIRVLSVDDDGVLLGSSEGDKQTRVPLQGGIAAAPGR